VVTLFIPHQIQVELADALSAKAHAEAEKESARQAVKHS
jgi:hypothetical protein